MLHKFKKKVDAFNKTFEKFESNEKKLLQYREALVEKLSVDPQTATLSKGNPLCCMAEDMKSTIANSINGWTDKWRASSPMRELSKTYDNKIILLVFGKVNSGKSSFCNFIADAVGEGTHRYFYVEKGKIIPSDRPFDEDVIECTNVIQGVEFESNLVLIDTPGLHAVTDENHELTKCFTDSSDAVLWITDSASPGQVLELDDLREEIQRKKPFLPIITKSDEVIKDSDENGNIIKTFRVKDPERRELQESDVKRRAQECFLKSGLTAEMKDPISISVHFYKKSNPASVALEESGINRLYSNLIPIIDEAHRYKKNKATKQIVNYLEEVILKTLNNEIVPAIEEIKNTVSREVKELKEKISQISIDVINDILLDLPDLIEKHKKDKDTKGLSKAISQSTNKMILEKVEDELKCYIKKIGKTLTALPNIDVGEFEERYIEIQQVKGHGVKAVGSAGGGAAGAWAGAEIGTYIYPGLGTAIGWIVGGILGGILGSAGGECFVETYTVKENIGVSIEKVQVRTAESIRQAVPKLVKSLINSCIEGIEPLGSYANHITENITLFEEEVHKLKEQL